MDLAPSSTLLWIGLGLNALTPILAYIRRSLNLSGMISAMIMGGIIFIIGGFFLWSILIGFFISSSVLSQYKKKYKKRFDSLYAKTSQRDSIQVIANGGVGLVCALIYAVVPDPLVLVLYGVSFASVNADTWASELGILSKKDPVFLWSQKRVQKGQSGGVTCLGTLAAFSGAIFIALIYTFGIIWSIGWSSTLVWHGIIIIVGGVFGSLIDSLLGETVQAQYCQENSTFTEKPISEKGAPNPLVKGWRWLNNDGVNFSSCLATTLLMFGIGWIVL
jgi:uncharacterized protein (TIGR00297 family)